MNQYDYGRAAQRPNDIKDGHQADKAKKARGKAKDALDLRRNDLRAALGVDEFDAAHAINVSVHTLRKDRRTARKFPFYKIGKRVIYSLDRLRETLVEFEVGGTSWRRNRPGRRGGAK